MKTMQMQSCVHENGTVECTLVEVELPEPGPDDVVVEIAVSYTHLTLPTILLV